MRYRAMPPELVICGIIDDPRKVGPFRGHPARILDKGLYRGSSGADTLPPSSIRLNPAEPRVDVVTSVLRIRRILKPM